MVEGWPETAAGTIGKLNADSQPPYAAGTVDQQQVVFV